MPLYEIGEYLERPWSQIDGIVAAPQKAAIQVERELAEAVLPLPLAFRAWTGRGDGNLLYE